MKKRPASKQITKVFALSSFCGRVWSRVGFFVVFCLPLPWINNFFLANMCNVQKSDNF
jgi:hypothetical protein